MICVCSQNTSSATPHPTGSRKSRNAAGWKVPATRVQPKQLGAGNEARAGLGGLGPGKRVHQDISVKECSYQASEATRQVLKNTHQYAYTHRYSHIHPHTIWVIFHAFTCTIVLIAPLSCTLCMSFVCCTELGIDAVHIVHNDNKALGSFCLFQTMLCTFDDYPMAFISYLSPLTDLQCPSFSPPWFPIPSLLAQGLLSLCQSALDHSRG